METLFTTLFSTAAGVSTVIGLIAFTIACIVLVFYLLNRNNKKFIDTVCTNIRASTNALIDIKVDVGKINTKLDEIDDKVGNVENATNACYYIKTINKNIKK